MRRGGGINTLNTSLLTVQSMHIVLRIGSLLYRCCLQPAVVHFRVIIAHLVLSLPLRACALLLAWHCRRFSLCITHLRASLLDMGGEACRHCQQVRPRSDPATAHQALRGLPARPLSLAGQGRAAAACTSTCTYTPLHPLYIPLYIPSTYPSTYPSTCTYIPIHA